MKKQIFKSDTALSSFKSLHRAFELQKYPEI